MSSVAVGLWVCVMLIITAQVCNEKLVKHPLKSANLSQALFMYAIVLLIAAVAASVIALIQHVLDQ